jgi:hypothetical protein
MGGVCFRPGADLRSRARRDETSVRLEATVDQIDQMKGRTIATRNLLYAVEGSHAKKAFTVCIGEPYLITEESSDFEFAPGATACSISFIGLPERAHVVHGADGIQALELAVSSIEWYLRRLSQKYEFYFSDSEGSYFDD